MRSILAEMADEGELRVGWYLVMVTPAATDLTYPTLGEHLLRATEAAAASSQQMRHVSH